LVDRRPERQADRPSGEPLERLDEERRKQIEERLQQLQVGQVVRGKVVSLAAFGAFVALDNGNGLTGLLHKTELAHEYVSDPAQILQLGQDVEVKILEIQRRENDRPRIGLSRKALLPPPEPRADNRTRTERLEGRQDGRPDRRPQQQAGDRPQGGPHSGERQGERSSGRPQGGDRGGRDNRGGMRDQQGRRDRGRPPEPDYPPVTNKIVSLGEMLMAKLKEQQSKGQEPK
jgi:predicted RNA-binding protein with RPS1 domain